MPPRYHRFREDLPTRHVTSPGSQQWCFVPAHRLPRLAKAVCKRFVDFGPTDTLAASESLHLLPPECNQGGL
jgi:hypothetical protein